MDYDVIDPAPFTSDLFFYLDLGSPEIQVPDCMSLETPSDLLEVTPTSSGGTTSSTSNNTEDASSSRSISRDVTEETSGTAPINLQLPAGSESTSDSNSASNGEGEGVDSPHLSEENNEPHEQDLDWDGFLVYSPCEVDVSLPDPEAPVEANVDRTPPTNDDTVEEPPRKRIRARRRQIVPAEISYSQLAGAAPTQMPPRTSAPTPTPTPTRTRQGPSFADPQTAVIPLPPTTAASENPCGQTYQPLFPQFHGQTMSVPLVPTGTNVLYESVSLTALASVTSRAHFIPSRPTVEETFSWQGQIQAAPAYPPPAATPSARPFAPQPSRPARKFTFAENTVPSNFVPNPNNHGRWLVDELGRRHYLNAPKNKRPRMEVT
ncbi:hypothetical protein VTN96DRAFT_234 [Rasamsonia emersonii]